MALAPAYFPTQLPRSIVGAGAFHVRVRDGNGWDHPALATKATRNHALQAPVLSQQLRVHAERSVTLRRSLCPVTGDSKRILRRSCRPTRPAGDAAEPSAISTA